MYPSFRLASNEEMELLTPDNLKADCIRVRSDKIPQIQAVVSSGLFLHLQLFTETATDDQIKQQANRFENVALECINLADHLTGDAMARKQALQQLAPGITDDQLDQMVKFVGEMSQTADKLREQGKTEHEIEEHLFKMIYRSSANVWR